MVNIFKDGNLIRLPVVDDRMRKLVSRTLTYSRKSMLYGGKRDTMGGQPFIVSTDVECFFEKAMADTRQIVTNAGYTSRLTKELTAAGYKVSYQDLRPSKNKRLSAPCWSNIDGFELRAGQREALESYVNNERGQIWWATGIGKSYLVPLMCRLYPKANIVVTTKFLPTLNDLYRNIAMYLPSVGINCSTKKKMDKRVMCVSAGSLHKVDFDKTDILIADEHHELATDKMFESFAKFRFSRMYGLSANFTDRSDNADFELEGVFGPLIASMSYEEGVRQGLIVPIRVLWQDVHLDHNPADGVTHDVARKRAAIWRNDDRNEIIANNAKEYPDDQVLITVKTFDHACHLKKLLPDYTLVYAPGDRKEDDIERYIKWKLLQRDEPSMTADRLEMLKRNFETGRLRKAIATTVWNRGVNFRNLQVLIRADASASAIDDTQIPGRLSRLGDGMDKPAGLLIDYLDQFDDGLMRKSKSRQKNYKSKGWLNEFPSSKDSTRRRSEYR